jgi:hypothetical protein
LPPVEGQRAELTVTALDTGLDTTRFPVRLVLDDRIRGAGTLSSGAETVIALPPVGTGWVRGYVDADPDPLRADDRRWFAYRSRPAPTVALGGSPPVFVTEAAGVLEGSSRLRPSPPGLAELLVAQDGIGLDQRGPETATLVLPPEDATLLPALNRRLADGGIPWRYEPRGGGGDATLEGASLPGALAGVRVQRWLSLVGTVEGGGGSRTLADAAGDPWAVEGTDPGGRRYLLLASPLTAVASTLPVSSAMVRFLDWVAGQWAGPGSTPDFDAGDYVPAPAGATQVRFPSGREVEIDGTGTVRGTSEAGVYTFLAADSVVGLVALNPPPAESRLEPLDRAEQRSAIGRTITRVEEAEDWPREVYRSRVGPEVWWPLLLGALLLLLLESLLASSGRGVVPARGRARPA